jgi:hypothetical protein
VTERSVTFDDVSGQDYIATVIRTKIISTEDRENETGEGNRSTPKKNLF